MIELPIIWNTDETAKLEELDLPVNIDHCEIRMVTFFNINAVSPYLEENIDASRIHCNGDSFICSLPYEQLLQCLEKL